MKKPILVHGIWAAVAVAAFVLGAQGIVGSRTDDEASAASGGTRGAKGSGVAPSAGRGGGGSGSDASRPVGAGKGAWKTIDGRSVLILSEQEIADLGEKFRTAGSPIDRRFAFSRLLEGLTPENAQLIREQIDHLKASSPEFKEFHYAWGAVAGKDAVLFGAKTEKGDMGPAMAGWASVDPSAAIAWVHALGLEGNQDLTDLFGEREVKPDEFRRHLAGGLVQGLANNDPDAAADFVIGLAASDFPGASGYMHVVVGEVLRAGDPAEAANWTTTLPEGEIRSIAMNRVAGHFAGNDPEAAAQWATNVADEQGGTQVVGTVSGKWAWSDPQAALDWVGSLPEGEARARGYGSGITSWAHRDMEAAGEFVSQMEASPERDAAISGYANRIAYENPAAGIEWASSVEDPNLRERALVRTGQTYLRRNPAAAREWLPTSGLSEQAQQEILNAPRGDKRHYQKD